MEQMDSTVIATALPAIAADIQTNPISLKLALTAYLVSLAIFIPISGWMADRFGARRIFAIAIGVFLAGSVACAVSGSLVEFVAARFLQGMGGNFIMALIAWLCGVGWCFTMCCWVPDPYGKQPRVAVTDMER